MIVASEFEIKWKDIMTEYGLIGDKWFDGIYDIKQYWIPAFFGDIPMSGVCRTTSISESVNAFFDHFLSRGSSLVEFLMHYDSAMDSQRQTNDRLNSLDKMTMINLKTPLAIEKHAAYTYTKSQFLKVQEEIEVSCFNCHLKGTEQQLSCTTYAINDGFSGLVKVTHAEDRDDFDCNCNKFTRDGMLCSHIFWVLNHLEIIAIPVKYIVHRWSKTAYENPISDPGMVPLDTSILLDDKKKKINSFACIRAVESDDAKCQILIDGVSGLKEALVHVDGESSPSNMNNKFFEIFYGGEKPVQVDVHDPQVEGGGSSQTCTESNANVQEMQ